MASYGSSRGRIWLVLMTAIGAALVSLLAFLQWERPAWANDRGGRGPQIVLEDGIDPAFPRSEAANQGDFEAQIVGGTPVPDGKYPFMASVQNNRAGTSPYEDHFCGGTLVAAQYTC